MRISSSHLFSFVIGASSMSLIAIANADDAGSPPAAHAPHAVVHSSNAVTRVAPSGKARIMRFAGREDGAKNAFFGLLKIDSGAKVPTHRDATEEYIYISEGQGVISIDGVAHEVQAGTGIFMPANAEVNFAVTGEGPVTAVQFFAGQGPEAKYSGWALAE